MKASDVLAFLEEFDEAQASRSFDVVAPMIHPDAFFRFNDGDYRGVPAIRSAFEATWALGIADDRYRTFDIEVVVVDASSAVATFSWRWTGTGEDGPIAIEGRGTTVVVRHGGRLKVLLEHLSG